MITNLEIASNLSGATRANILMAIDDYIRTYFNDEEIFMEWLEEGVPDGTKTYEELEDTSAEDFVEMVKLAEKVLTADGIKWR